MPTTSNSLLNLPNLLTTARLGLAVVLFALIANEQWPACLIVFVVAAFTDWLDGFLARKQGITSAFGRNFDPLVDKVLVGGAFIFLLPVAGAKLTAWMVTVVVSRELVVTGLRSYFEGRGAKFGADWLGKIKMVLQCAVLIDIFLVLGWPEGWWTGLQIGLIYAMVIATAVSGIQYLLKAALLFSKTES